MPRQIRIGTPDTFLAETYPDEQLNEDRVADGRGNVQRGTKVRVAVRQVDDGRRAVSENKQRAVNVPPRDTVKQLLTTSSQPNS